MDKSRFLIQQARYERVWGVTLCLMLIASCVAITIYTWTHSSSPLLATPLSSFYPEDSVINKVFSTVFALLIGVGGLLALLMPIDTYLHRTVLRTWWIEDHADVIKVFGAVRSVDMSYVNRKILKVKAGYILVNDAYKRFGCTLAAVKATEADLEAKKNLEEMGFKVGCIG